MEFELLKQTTELLGTGLCQPLGCLDFSHLMMRVVLTDSGSI